MASDHARNIADVSPAEKQPVLIIFKIPVARGVKQMPMVSGTSCITICVGPAGRSHTVPLSQPNIPLAPSISIPNNSFSTRGYLSSAYHAQPYHRTSASLNRNDAEVERAARNIVKGPRNSKHGSIKFGKKPRRPPPPAAQGKKDPDAKDADKLPPQSSRPPAPLPRTLIGEQVKTVKKDMEFKDTDIGQERLRSRTELKLDLKPVYDNHDNVIQEKVSEYQPVPDIVSMTQKGSTLSPVKEVAVLKPPFRIDRSKSPQPLVSANKHASENRKVKEKEVIAKDKKVTLPANPTEHREVMKVKVTKATKSQIPPGAPKGGPARRTFKPQQNAGHPLHEELMNKFGNSSVSSGNVPRLRKVKTKEPKSVKELFGDCKFSITGLGKVQEYQNLEVNYKDANNSGSRLSKDVVSSCDIPKPLEVEYPGGKQARNIKSLRQENITLVGKNFPPLSEEKFSDQPKKGTLKPPKDTDSNPMKSQTSVEPPLRQKHKSKVKNAIEKGAIDRLGKMTPNTPADIGLGAHNAPVDLSAKHKSVGIVSHHESLRVPWKGPPADFKRGGGLASYTPSKIQLGSTFELGVSRTPPPVQAPPPVPSAPSERVEEDYLRPADESETVTWSAESTSDMLF